MKIIYQIILFFLFSFSANAASNLAISSWQENTTLTDNGKISQIRLEGITTGFTANQVMTAFSIGFDKKRNIRITKTTFNNSPANYSFSDNVLTINFTQPKRNNEPIIVAFSYEENYEKISKYLRQEAIDVPPFATGANAKITINFPWNLESATLNPNIIKQGNSFIYNGTVPQNGVREIIKLTESQNTWDVNVKVRIDANQALTNLTVTLPDYFTGNGQIVNNFVSMSNIKPEEWNKEKDGRMFKFNTDKTNLTIYNKATIIAKTNSYNNLNRNPNSYLALSEEDANLLRPILAKIKSDTKYNNLPLYAKIGKFVHEFIHYDISYVDKLPKIKEILQNPTGVCTEYTRLYNGLSRLAGIPTIMVDGGACGEYDNCQGHAWNIIYQDNKWIPVDATWDLMSGVVSSSHIYFSDFDKGSVHFQYVGNTNMKASSKMDFDMKDISN
ncbi:MAG: hypothetical protein KGQ36_01485 [Rickettsiales bacterium]|nr:hypothetical protein [Rickettsiales bacterium]